MIVNRWRALENVIRERDLDWGCNYAPVDLRWARTSRHPRGARLDHLLPADYRAFVAEIGYPVVGFQYYDLQGISFLPPEPMARLSVDLPDPDGAWPEAVDGEPTVCRHAFFAGSDLSDVEGYSFGPGGTVWEVENGGPRKEIGTFTEWFDGEITRLTDHATTWTPQPRGTDGWITYTDDRDEDEVEIEDDPHRLLNYSLHGHYGQEPYSAADLELSWVASAERSLTWGLIDAAGTWRIPLGARFRDVRPFRDGVAEVVPESASDRVRIRPDGSAVT